MTYELEFSQKALKEWSKLDHSVQEQFKKHLAVRLANPHVPSAKLRGSHMANMYKIKLRDLGYRLVYEVRDTTLRVVVISVGKRDKLAAYRDAQARVGRAKKN
jgi:mRNA interferase RelE/StbE